MIAAQTLRRKCLKDKGIRLEKTVGCWGRESGSSIGVVPWFRDELDALVNIDFTTRTIKPQLTSLNIIRVGTSGSLQADIPTDSFVASTHGLGIDNLLNFYRYEENEEEDFYCDNRKGESRFVACDGN